MQKDAMRLYIVRHGETAENVKMAYLGLGDEPMNANGRRQAACVAEALSPLPLRLIVSSPMRRTLDTAGGIAAAGIELRQDERLREGSFGTWEGLTRREVLARSPEDAELLLRWEEDSAIAPPGGESSEAVQKRVVDLVQDLAGKFPGEAVVLVSHVGPIKALLAATLGISLNASRRLFLDPGTISVVDWGDWPVVRLFNSHAHLGWTAARWMS
ncbi:MAG: histidine phosphatase family protein [Acidobacteriota bacterium]|jgi:broad specificity phosphatase PhoE|nr:histidine phosphatase family protein [Acidobacteriota bacterium]